MKTEKQQAAAAAEFAERWKGRGYEKGDSQIYWTELLTEVFGIENPSTFVRYEEQVKVDKTNLYLCIGINILITSAYVSILVVIC